MKFSIQTERNFAVVVLLCLLICAFKVRVDSHNSLLPFNENINRNLIDSQVEIERTKSKSKNEDDLQRVAYDDIREHIDVRVGNFKKAQFIPKEESITQYGNSAVKNRIIEIEYQQGQSVIHQRVKVIEVYELNHGIWRKTPQVGGTNAVLASL